MNKIEKQLYGRTLKVEIGDIARQANGTALVQFGDTVVLVTVCLGEPPAEEYGFLPLTVDYRERTYAAGKIPGGFYKREGRPREREILISRLTDRAIRPLFEEDFDREVQVMVTVLSVDTDNDPAVLSLLGASVALNVSDIPFSKLLGVTRIGRLENEFIVNPTLSQLEHSDLDIIVAGTEEGIIMVEGSAKEIPEEIISEALKVAEREIKAIIELEKEILTASKPKLVLSKVNKIDIEENLSREIVSFLSPLIDETLRFREKKEREKKLEETKKITIDKYIPQVDEKTLNRIIENVFYQRLRYLILNQGIRPDGRKPDEIREINCAVGILPRTHGSAIFTRGQTQALVTVTLGSSEDMQVMDELTGEYKERFLVHYNFPPFSTGEVRPNRGPGRREIGHGMLAKRALEVVLPVEENFPYTIRIVSDILESNGSSSMASVCGGSLALFDAGVSVSSAVAGIAMGLVKEGEKYVILTDIVGLEDHAGDLDLKVAGTHKGITVLQMDVKDKKGINLDIVQDLLLEAKNARFFVLEKMEEVIKTPRAEISTFAPRMIQMQIPEEKIGALIGPGGKNIRKITEETGTEIDIQDEGKVSITAADTESLELARQMVEYYTADVEVGKIYKGKALRITKFGAFVEILPGKEGLVHISQLDENRVAQVEDIVHEGDEIIVKLTEIDSEGRIVLSRKQALRELKNKELPTLKKIEK
ncbi:MAG TPA: polyribonucleotide nucleotidyltransferase [Elusimicrobia bacterium]|nr:polyribonucleotide nucleotidyltransferase [Elusimicrobiota bacterium]